MGIVNESSRPLLRIVKGDPAPEEIAALVAVLSARAATADEATRSVSTYADPSAGMRTAVRVGAGAWVASGRTPGTRTKASW
jgi:hypothetical protein